MFPRREMLDLVTVDGQARGIVCRNLVTGKIESHAAQAVLLCTGGYGNVFYLSTNAKGCNVTAAWRAHKRGHSSATRATRRSIRPVSGHRRSPVEAHTDERKPPQRRTRLGPQDSGRHTLR